MSLKVITERDTLPIVDKVPASHALCVNGPPAPTTLRQTLRMTGQVRFN